MVLKHIGVTAFGVPIYFKHFGKTSQDKEMLFSALIEAFNAIGDQLELGRIDTVAFGGNLLHVTPTKKGYRVIAIADSREWYVKNLVKKVADLIDQDENIPEPTGFVDDEIVNAIKNLLDKFIIEEIPISEDEVYGDLKLVMDLAEEIVGKGTAKSLQKKVDEAKNIKFASWTKFFESVEGDLESAIKLAWEGKISASTAIILRLADTPMMVALAIRLGILANLFHKLIAPPLDLLKQLVDYLVEENVFVGLMRNAVGYYFYWSNIESYKKLFEQALEEFKPEDNVDSEIKALILLDPLVLEIKNKYAEKLFDYYKKKTEALLVYFKLISEANSTLRRIMNADIGDAQHVISILEHRLKETIKQSEKALGRGKSGSYGLESERSVELMKNFFEASILAELYTRGLAYVIRHLSTDIDLKLKLLSQALVNMDSILDVLFKNMPMYLPSCVGFMKESAVILEYGIRVGKQSVVNNIIDRYKKLLMACNKIIVEEYDKVKRFYPWIASVLASFSSMLMYLGDSHPQIFELLYLLSRLIDKESLKNIKMFYPEIFATFISDILFVFAFVFIRRGADKYAEKLKKIVNDMIQLAKWKLFRGYTTILSILRILIIATRIIPHIDPTEAEQITSEIRAFLELFVEDLSRRESEVALLGEELIIYLRELVLKVPKEEYKNLLKEFSDAIIKLYKRRGYKQKIKKLKALLEGKEKESVILELF